MKEIVIISGKGGTGKTSITAALGALAGEKAVMADCDVDAANLHILFEPKINKEEDFYSGKKAVIDNSLCTDCGICQEKCAFDAIYYIEGQYFVDEVNCEGCSVCFHLCPVNAIRMEESLAGKWYQSTTRFNNPFVHARLGIGQENSGKLVAKVKQEAKKIAENENIPFIFVDGPPGVGCPVISSLSNVDHVLLVTEATQSGLHDLQRLVELIEYFKLNASCVVNKSDLNEQMAAEISDYCQKHHITVINHIPYDPVFLETLNLKKTLIEGNEPTIKAKISEIYEFLTREEEKKR
ncbi:ATP-binding protein [Caldithrix abyssi]